VPVSTLAATNFATRWPTLALVGVGVGILVVGVLLGLAIWKWRGNRAIAQRLTALGERLGVVQSNDNGRVERSLAFLEEVTSAASAAVSESSADAVRLRRSLDTLPTGLVLCNETGDVVYRNSQAEELMASRYGDALAAQTVTEALDEGWRLGLAQRTLELYGPPRRTLAVRAQVIDDGLRPLGVLATIEDVSEKRRLEEVRRDFIANVSHELRTPMGALGLLAETLQIERDPVIAQRLTERIHTESLRVNRIIEDLLDLSRLEAEGAPAREPVPVGLFVAEAVERIRTAAEQRSVTITFEDPETALLVTGDRRQLVSAVHALLENAVSYSPSPATVVVQATRHDPDGVQFETPWIRLAIIDQGIGIPAKDLDRVFERFYRVDPGRARHTGGTGLGLSIVRHVAVNHGGHVSVTSREGAGSTFFLDLPMTTA
jgi:two-component system, OmpR family, sensor histidine kinase SenX3